MRLYRARHASPARLKELCLSTIQAVTHKSTLKTQCAKCGLDIWTTQIAASRSQKIWMFTSADRSENWTQNITHSKSVSRVFTLLQRYFKNSCNDAVASCGCRVSMWWHGCEESLLEQGTENMALVYKIIQKSSDFMLPSYWTFRDELWRIKQIL